MAKPFEVADFGAAVQALLGPTSAESTQPRRSLDSLGPADIALAQSAGSRTVVVEVYGKEDKSGEIHVVDGQIVHAVAGKGQTPPHSRRCSVGAMLDLKKSRTVPIPAQSLNRGPMFFWKRFVKLSCVFRLRRSLRQQNRGRKSERN